MPPPSKKRKLQMSAVEEITFDPAARQEYLTGFHKRKLQRAKQAQEAAEKRARAEKIEERKKLREERKAELERHVEEVNALLRPAIDTDASESSNTEDPYAPVWAGVEDVPAPPIDHEAEYIDEEKYTTVTVEEIDVSKGGLRKAEEELRDEDSEIDAKAVDQASSVGRKKREWTKEKPKDKRSKPKVKGKKFRYEGKAERKVTRMKEKSKNSRQAKARRSG